MRKTHWDWGETGGLSPIFPAANVPFPKSLASYFRFAGFNTSALYYLRAWHRLLKTLLLSREANTLPQCKSSCEELASSDNNLSAQPYFLISCCFKSINYKEKLRTNSPFQQEIVY